MYEGASIVDYLKSVGQPTDYASRAKLASSKGIQGYSGTAQQNTQLLNMLRGGGSGAPITQQPGTTPKPQAQASVPSFSSNPVGGDTELQQLAKTDRNPIQETRYQELLRQQQSAGGGSVPTFNQPTINLPQLYENLYASSGITDIENELSAKARAYTEQVAKIKDNPYLSEATMTGRLRKLDEKFNADSANIRNDIAMRKADIETKLNLETKQFDIQSDQARQAFDQFNSLLASGGLDNASGEDIALITRSTGIPSSVIQSAIGTSRAKNAPKVNTQVIQIDDGTNIKAVVINQDTGETINETVIGQSKPEKTGGAKKASESEQKEYYADSLRQDAQAGLTLSQIFQLYTGYLDPNLIYQLYNANSRYGPDPGNNPEKLAVYGVKVASE